MPDLDLKAYLELQLSEINSYEKRARYIQKEIDSADKRYAKLIKEMDKYSRSDAYTSPEYAVNAALKEAPKILYQEMLSAARINTEFNHEFFLSRLRSAAYNPQTFTIIETKGGKLKVKINLNQTAGSLSDYGQAVRAVRSAIKKYVSGLESFKGIPPEAPYDVKAHFWEEKFYKSAREGGVAIIFGTRMVKRKSKQATFLPEDNSKRITINKTAAFAKKYWETMHRRMEASGKIAPFWEILDKGTPAMTAKGSGRWAVGGYPKNEATNFVEKAAMRIAEVYQTGVVKASTTKDAFDMKNAEATMTSIENDVKVMKKLLGELNTSSLDVGAEILLRVQDKIELIDKVKLTELEEKIKAGVALPKGGVYLGTPGNKVRVRFNKYANSLAEKLNSGTI